MVCLTSSLQHFYLCSNSNFIFLPSSVFSLFSIYNCFLYMPNARKSICCSLIRKIRCLLYFQHQFVLHDGSTIYLCLITYQLITLMHFMQVLVKIQIFVCQFHAREKKKKEYVIPIIASSIAAVLVLLFIFSVLAICRRKRQGGTSFFIFWFCNCYHNSLK